MKVIYNDGHVAECPEEEELHVIRHTAAHILAQAVKRLYPQAHFAYGPATEKGLLLRRRFGRQTLRRRPARYRGGNGENRQGKPAD